MLLVDAENLALELMKQFGLLPHWRFEFDDAVRRFGCCHRNRTWRFRGAAGLTERESSGKITLSRELVTRNGREQVEDVIRHEIAHAICPPRSGHGPVWKQACVKTGANPERCYDSEEVDTPQGDWSATCAACGTVYYRFKRPRAEYWCSDKECKHQSLPYVPGGSRLHPMRKLTFRHKNALTSEPKAPRAVIEAMKAKLRGEQPPKDSGWLQCVKCDTKSLGSKVCPACDGELKPEAELQAEKTALKKRIAELERKAGK